MKYLWPYRGWLTVSVICVVLIAVLWGGGLAALLPGAKILISKEGLHGWAWRSMTEDRLGIGLAPKLVPSGIEVDGRPLSMVIEVADVTSGGSAKDKLRENDWIIGFDDGEAVPGLMRADAMIRELAELPAGSCVSLRLYNPHIQQGPANPRTITVTLKKAHFTSRGLVWAVTDLPKNPFHLLVMLLGLVMVVTVVRDLLRFAQEYIVQTVVYNGLMDLRCDNYNVVLRLPTTFFSEKGASDSMSRFVQDTGELARGQMTLFGKTMVEPAKAIASFTLAMCISWQLTLLTLVVGPPAFILIRKFGKIMKRASRRALESWASMLAVLEETLTGIRVVKAYTMENAERKRFLHVNRQLLKQQRRMARIDAATAPTVEALGIIAAMGAIAIAGYWVLNNLYGMDRDKFFVLLASMFAMFDPVRKLAHVVTRFQRAEAAATRIFELQDQQQEKRLPNAPMLPPLRESLEFHGVCFRYPGAAEDALTDINLTIRCGETVAIVGPNGCGKTTLVSLLPRLIDPSAGEVLIDGRDVSKMSLRSLRRQIGVVTQETIIFHATIGENIAYGLRRPKHQNILAASEKAYVDEFVRNLPGGYDTMVGAHGATLSGGQRQRIAIARAILRDPAILIFDEATSQIDADSERRIHQAMEEFVKGRTTLMIAHRFATVLSADRIVVMNEGRIIDTGTHAELLKTCELYKHLYNTQFADSGGTI